MSHLDNTAYLEQRFFQSNPTNFQIERNPDISVDFRQYQLNQTSIYCR